MLLIERTPTLSICAIVGWDASSRCRSYAARKTDIRESQRSLRLLFFAEAVASPSGDALAQPICQSGNSSAKPKWPTAGVRRDFDVQNRIRWKIIRRSACQLLHRADKDQQAGCFFAQTDRAADNFLPTPLRAVCSFDLVPFGNFAPGSARGTLSPLVVRCAARSGASCRRHRPLRKR